MGPPHPRPPHATPDREQAAAAAGSSRNAGPLSGLHVLVAHPGAELYGSDRVVLESVVAMVRAGAAVEVTVPETGPLIDELSSAGATIAVEPALVLRKSMMHPRRWPATVVAGIRAFGASGRLLGRRPDLVYVNTITLPIWPLLARIRAVPVLTHIHEAESGTSRLLLRALYLPHLFADATIANSEFSCSVIGRAYRSLARRTRVIYNGVAGPVANTPARMSLEGGPVRLAYVGRLSPRKGTDLVIAAVAELIADGMDVELDVAGEAFRGYEWFADELRETVARRGLDSRVRFLGFQDDVWATLEAADVVVVPSRVGEPFGNTAVEAALAARPLIVSESSGLVEATHGLPGVHRVRPGDASAIAEAVREIVARWPMQREQARAAARLAALRFDPERYRASIIELLAGLVRARV
ncbi:glycosyltransferase family 4 protein [Agromyces sp. SYSU K20354]|uniref:glycosyltransferase family 4 protein n=1 Tax=Agromyces cavernae TaxID=2898659 RepID=UPI001E293963|nr:glycosyltransferase family 4 protein [Agromyces cavernae]MCD2440990.1 glycosyltransferase family 4 protein [Agromyces cavernae]